VINSNSNNWGGRDQAGGWPDRSQTSRFPTHRQAAGANDWGTGRDSGYSTPSRGSGPGEGTWRDGKHIIGQSNPRLEKELFGDANDPSKQHTGINFEKYDDIPVEATGAKVPEPVLSFTAPPLDPLLLENIKLARYNTPTPVQKYSIPVILTSKSDRWQ